MAILTLSSCSVTPAPKPTTSQRSTPPPVQEVDLSAQVAQVRDAYNVPGMSVLLFDAQGILGRGRAGVRSSGDETPIGVQDLFHLGSCTKAMTATVMMRLAERGLFDMSATLPQAFAGLTVDASWREVTMWDLLRHRSGAASRAPVQTPGIWKQMWSDARKGVSAKKTRAAVAAALLSQPATHTRGEYHYSNFGYVLAGGALERATGVSWEVLMQRELFGPLGMQSCGFGPAGSTHTVDQPRGHKLREMGHQPVAPSLGADNPASLGPAGVVHCSLEDWATFVRVHLGAGPKGYLSRDALQRLHEAPSQGRPYAAGWSVLAREGQPDALMHSGSNTMNYAVVFAAPGSQRGLVAAANAADPNTKKALRALAKDLAKTHLQEVW